MAWPGLEPPTLGFTLLRVTCNNKIIIRRSWVIVIMVMILVNHGDCMPYCSQSRALYHYTAWYRWGCSWPKYGNNSGTIHGFFFKLYLSPTIYDHKDTCFKAFPLI